MTKKIKTVSLSVPLFFLFIFLMPVLMFPSTASARQKKNYIVGKLGAYSPGSSDLSGFSSDFSGGFALGHYFNRNFATEFEFGYFQTSGTVLVSNNERFFAQDDINATFLAATAKLVFPVPYYYSPSYRTSYINFYVGAGAGVYFANENIDAIGVSASDTVPGAHILGGADFNLNSNFFLGLEIKYLWARPDLVLGKTSLDGLIFSGAFGYNF